MLVPGLFSNADVGEAWPDGDGSFHLDGATPYSTADAVDFSNAFHLDAIVFKQLRAINPTQNNSHFSCPTQ